MRALSSVLALFPTRLALASLVTLLTSAGANSQPAIFGDGLETGGVCDGWSLVFGIDEANCEGAGWQAFQYPSTVFWSPCATVRVYGLVAGDRLLLTTCGPTSAGATGDSVIQTVVDNVGHEYLIGNDDCDLSPYIPQLTDWSCLNEGALQNMSCSPQDGSGFEVLGTWIDVTICGYNGSSGHSPLYIWDNGTSSPNGG